MIVSFNRRRSTSEKLKIIKYVEEGSNHTTYNYYGVPRPTIRYSIKEKEELKQITKKSTVTLHKDKLAKNIFTWSWNSWIYFV